MCVLDSHKDDDDFPAVLKDSEAWIDSVGDLHNGISSMAMLYWRSAGLA